MTTRIRLLAIDIDGTLLDSRHQLPEANRVAVAHACHNGVEVVLVTGRRFAFAEPIVAEFGVPMTVIASNGALIKSSEGVTVERQLLPRRHAREVLSAAGNFRETSFLLFDRPGKGQIVSERIQSTHAPAQRYLERNRDLIVQVQRLEEALDGEDPIQVLFLGGVNPMRALEAQLQASSCAVSISVTRAEYPERDLTILDVLDYGCNKGAALARWAKARGVAPAEVMAIGDNWNDREMLEFAGLPVLMANSCDELKERGWAVTAGNDENGVAVAIERHLSFS